MKSRITKLAGVAAAAVLTLAAAPPHWSNRVVPSEHGHLVGNPAATVKLIGWASYTCPHCAHFTVEGEAALALGYLPNGKVNYEIRPFIRNIVDVSATLLANCGDPKKFRANHDLLMKNQATWLGKAQTVSAAQQQRWGTGTFAERMRAIASDLDLYALMAKNNYERPELDRCLADEAKAKKIAEQSRTDATAFKIQGTPSFALNGKLLDATHDWKALEPHLKTALK